MNYINIIAESLDDLDYDGPEIGPEFGEAVDLPDLRLPDGKLLLTKYGGERNGYGDGHIEAELIRPGRPPIVYSYKGDIYDIIWSYRNDLNIVRRQISAQYRKQGKRSGLNLRTYIIKIVESRFNNMITMAQFEYGTKWSQRPEILETERVLDLLNTDEYESSDILEKNVALEEIGLLAISSASHVDL